jgi:RNA polymerase-binding transcription factor DksA
MAKAKSSGRSGAVKKAAKKSAPKAAAKVTAKAGAKAPAAKAAAVKTVLSKKEIDGYQEILVQKLAEIRGDLAGMREEALKSSGDASIESIADYGTDAFDQDFTLGLVESSSEHIEAIEEALARIEAGTYGACDACSDFIGKVRLHARPEARLCMPCQEREEDEG